MVLTQSADLGMGDLIKNQEKLYLSHTNTSSEMLMGPVSQNSNVTIQDNTTQHNTTQNKTTTRLKVLKSKNKIKTPV